MSLRSTSSADSTSKTEFDRGVPPPPGPRGPGPNKNDGFGVAPAMATKKRKREVGDDMDVGGASSEESADEGVEYVIEPQSSEPAFKRRRTTPVDNATRQRVSDAIAGGDLDALKKILEACPGCLNHQRNGSNATPLLEAVWWGQTGIARWLLEQGADPNICGNGYGAEDCHSPDDGELDQALKERYRLKIEASKKIISAGGYLLGQSALVHAALHGDLELIQLLVSFHAGVNVSDNRMTPLMGAVAAGHIDIACYLLKRGAEPAKECGDGCGKLEDKDALSMALWTAEMEIFQRMLETFDEGERNAVLKDSIEGSANLLPVDVMASLTELFPQWMSKILQIESPTGQPWLLELMLETWNLKIVRFLIDQGCAYKIRSDKDLSIAANVSPNKELVALMLNSIDSPDLREKFAGLCLYRNLHYRIFYLTDDDISDCNQWLINEVKVSPFFAPEVDIDLDSNQRQESPFDYLFHAAVSAGANQEVSLFFLKYQSVNFHVIGKKGKYPIELAAMLDDPQLFMVFSNFLGASDIYQAASIWSKFVERAAIKHQEGKAYEFLINNLVQIGVDVASEILNNVSNKIVDLQHWKALEFTLTSDQVFPNTALINRVNAMSGAKRVIVNDMLFLFQSLNFVGQNNWARDCWKNSASTAEVLDALSRQVGKSSEKFTAGLAKLGRAAGMTGIVMERSIETQAMLSFIRQALLGSGSNPGAFGSQFSNFIAHWLPVTDAWHWYLTSDAIYNQPKAPSSDFCFALTRLSFRQIDDLHEAGKRRQDEWARKIVDELPALSLRCVDTKTDELDSEALQRELIQRDIVAPNAIRLASLMQRAYRSARALNSSSLQSPALQLQQFSVRFATELAKLINDSEDNQVNQRATADAMLQLNQPEYRQLHLPKGMTPEFELQAQQMLTELAWWQLDALFRCFRKSIDGQSDAYARDYGPFIKFKNELATKKYFRLMDLSQIRRSMEYGNVGSGARRPSFYWGSSINVGTVFY